MKKILVSVLAIAIAIVLSLSISAFAAPVIEYVFGGTADDGNYYYYMFGHGVDNEATEVGINIKGRNENFSLDETGLEAAKTSTKFGIGIADPNNKLGDSFEATPYYVTEADGKISGSTKIVTKSETTDTDEIKLTKLTVNGKAVAGFYTGTQETEFYYGMESLPSTIEDFEANYVVAADVNLGTIAKTSTVKGVDGYAVKFEASYTSKDGKEKNKEYNIYFREYTETSETAIKTYYRVFNNLISAGYSFDYDDSSQQYRFYINTYDDDIYDDTKSSLGYVYFDIEKKEEYTPVYADFNTYYSTNTTASGTNGYTAYGIDMDLSDITLPTVSDITSGNYEDPFIAFKGFNSSDEFKIQTVEHSAGGKNILSSVAVKEGKNIMIFKSDEIHANYDELGYWRQLHYYGSYPSKITVKYVKKAPVIDAAMTDATLASLTVKNSDNKDLIAEFDPETYTYYVAVTDDTVDPGLTIEAEATNNKATAASAVLDLSAKQYTITVTAQDGTTQKTYYVKYRVPVSTTLTFDAAAVAGGTTQNYEKMATVSNNWFGTDKVGLVLDTADEQGYLRFTVDEEKDINLVSATLSATGARNNYEYQALENSYIYVYQNMLSYNDIKSYLDTYQTNSRLYQLGTPSASSDANLLASYYITSEDQITYADKEALGFPNNNYNLLKVGELQLDVEKMQIYEGNSIVIYVSGSCQIDGKATYYYPPTLTVKYIVCD